MTDPTQYPPPPGGAPAPAVPYRPCPACGGQIVSRHKEHTHKERRKFGAIYVLVSLTIVGFPIALIVWLMAPRKTVVTAVDRWAECTQCGALA